MKFISIKEIVLNRFAKTAITGALHRASQHYHWKKLVKLRSFTLHKFSKTQLEFNIASVASESKTEFVQSMQIVQSVAKTYWEFFFKVL